MLSIRYDAPYDVDPLLGDDDAAAGSSQRESGEALRPPQGLRAPRPPGEEEAGERLRALMRATRPEIAEVLRCLLRLFGEMERGARKGHFSEVRCRCQPCVSEFALATAHGIGLSQDLSAETR